MPHRVFGSHNSSYQKWAASRIFDPSALSLEPYEKWPVSELRKELKSRGLVAKGDKKSKIGRLYRHDLRKSIDSDWNE
jgi:hypothetical protein